VSKAFERCLRENEKNVLDNVKMGEGLASIIGLMITRIEKTEPVKLLRILEKERKKLSDAIKSNTIPQKRRRRKCRNSK